MKRSGSNQGRTRIPLSETNRSLNRSNKEYSVSPDRNKHPDAHPRYSTKEIIGIFKSLGRFQSPIETPDAFKIKDVKSLTWLMKPKATVVLQHFKSDSALPLWVGHDKLVRDKVISGAMRQINSKAF